MPHESREDYSESSESDLNLAKASLEIADQFEERNVPFPVTSVGYLAALSVEKKLKATLMGIYGTVSQTHDLKKLFWELPNDLQTDELRFGLEELQPYIVEYRYRSARDLNLSVEAVEEIVEVAIACHRMLEKRNSDD